MMQINTTISKIPKQGKKYKPWEGNLIGDTRKDNFHQGYSQSKELHKHGQQNSCNHTDQSKEATVEPPQVSNVSWLHVQAVICKPQTMLGFL